MSGVYILHSEKPVFKTPEEILENSLCISVRPVKRNAAGLRKYTRVVPKPERR